MYFFQKTWESKIKWTNSQASAREYLKPPRQAVADAMQGNPAVRRCRGAVIDTSRGSKRLTPANGLPYIARWYAVAFTDKQITGKGKLL
jgi:hypothetical protein